MPKITVLMPVYNGEKYIKEAIDSILTQTFTDFELLIVDDGSTDSTESIIKENNDARINFIKNETNKGVSYSANKGLLLAKGEYIARMDADDVALPNRLEKQLSFMEENNDIVLCCSNVQYVNDETLYKKKIKKIKEQLPVEWLILFSNPIAQPVIFFRKDIFIKNSWFYDEMKRLGEDYDLWTNIISLSKISLLPETLLYYREVSSSAFHSNLEKSYANAKKSNEKLINNLTGKKASCFHTYLTTYCAREDRPKTFVSVQEIKKWLDYLVDVLAKKWQWNQKTIQAVKKDYARIVVKYAIKLPKKILLKNIFKFWSFGFRFFFELAKEVNNYIKANIKRYKNAR